MIINMETVEKGIDLGVELHVSVMGRTPERQTDMYVVTAHPRRGREQPITSAPYIARSGEFMTATEAAEDALAKVKALPVPPNAADVIAEKDKQLADALAELEALKAAKPEKGKKQEQTK